MPPLSHDLELILRRPTNLRKAQAALDTLKILARNLITKNVRLLVALVQLFAC